MPLQLSYRPVSLDEFFGNLPLKKTIISVMDKVDKPHTYLLTGPSGCGKTTLSRIMANMLNCKDSDLVEYNISEMRGIDAAREIISSCKFVPMYGDVKVIILNECQKATNEFQNSMLEILEEPPETVFFILCTTEPEKLLKTIRNRCTTFHVSPLAKHDMIGLVNWILESEGKKVADKVRDAILFAAEGSPRVVVKILDQIIDLTDEEAQLQSISEITIDETLVIDICRKIISTDSPAKRWAELSLMLKGFDSDAEGARRAILGYLSTVILSKKGDEGKRIALIMSEFIHPYYDSGKAGLIISCYMSTIV